MAKKSTPEVPAFSGLADLTLTSADVTVIADALTYGRQGDYTETDAVAAVRSAGNRSRRDKRSAAVTRVAMATAVHGVVSADLVGKGKKYDTRGALGSALGVTHSSITGLATLGLAVAKGFGPEYTEWATLSSKAGRAESRELVEKATDGNDIANAVRATFTPKGDDNGTPRKAASEKGDGSPEQVQPEASPMEQIGAHLSAVDALVKGLSDDDWTLVGERFAQIVRRERTVRKAASKAPAA